MVTYGWSRRQGWIRHEGIFAYFEVMRIFAYLDHDNGIMSVYLLYICSNRTTEIYIIYIFYYTSVKSSKNP